MLLRRWDKPPAAQAFRPRIEAAAHRLLDRLPNEEIVDLVEHYAEPLPFEVHRGWGEAGTASTLIAYGIETLLANEDQLTELLDDLDLMPTVVERLASHPVAELARLETEVALTTLLRRFPHLTLGGVPRRARDGRLTELPIRL